MYCDTDKKTKHPGGRTGTSVVYINFYCLLYDVILNLQDSVADINTTLKFRRTLEKQNCLLKLKQVSPNISEWWSTGLLLWAGGERLHPQRTNPRPPGVAVNCCRIRMLISRNDNAALVHVSASHVVTITAYSSRLQPAGPGFETKFQAIVNYNNSNGGLFH
jgi:hypothetical protein